MKSKMMTIGTLGMFDLCRYFIRDASGYWNDKGSEWTREFRRATLYADPAHAAEKIHDLMAAQIPGEMRLFAVQLLVEVKSEHPVPAEALSAWLKKSVQARIDTRHGIGPVDNSMATLWIDWDDLTPTELPHE